MLQTAGLRQLRERDAKGDKENALADRLAFKPQAASSGALKAHPATSRRPLGNITNKGTDKSGAAPAGDKKCAATATTSRRAFGDITNQATAKAAPAPVSAKPASGLDLHGPKHAATAGVLRAKPALVVRHAPDGDIERRAGKGWDQLEAERLQQEDTMIRQRVHTLTSSLPLWPTTSLQGLSVSTRRHLAEDKDDMDMSPEPVIKPASLTGKPWRTKRASGVCTDLPGSPLSPSALELLTSPSPDCESLSDLLISSEEEDLLL